MTGDITVRGRTADVDLDLGDIIDILEDSFNGAFMGRFEAHKGNLFFTLDVNYIDLEDDHPTARGLETEVSLQSCIVEFGAGYRLGTWPQSPSVYPALSFDFLTGGRYVRLEARHQNQRRPARGVMWNAMWVGSIPLWGAGFG